MIDSGGYLNDKIGYKNALAVFNLVSMLGYVGRGHHHPWAQGIRRADAQGAHHGSAPEDKKAEMC